MDDGSIYSIGELARRTGLTVKTIRFYSDRGIVMPADRTPAGYRRYSSDAVAQLALVRTLRDLGLGLDVIRRVMDQTLSLSAVAAEHAAALDVQINILQLRRAVLAHAARRNPTCEEMERMHQVGILSEAEKRRLIDDFLDTIFDGRHSMGGLAGVRNSMTPAFPENPTQEQVEAWIELAQLATDTEFRAAVRTLVQDHLADGHSDLTPPRRDVVAITRDLVEPVMASGISPDSPLADPVVADLVAACEVGIGRPKDPDLQQWLVHRLEAANDPRRDRYFHLLAVINGWSTPAPLTPVIEWSIEALSTRTVA